MHRCVDACSLIDANSNKIQQQACAQYVCKESNACKGSSKTMMCYTGPINYPGDHPGDSPLTGASPMRLCQSLRWPAAAAGHATSFPGALLDFLFVFLICFLHLANCDPALTMRHA